MSEPGRPPHMIITVHQKIMFLELGPVLYRGSCITPFSPSVLQM